MTQPIDETLVRHISELARLKLNDRDIIRMAGELRSIVAYVDQLSEVDVTDVEPTAQVPSLNNVFREDRVRPSLAQDLTLSNAPQHDAGLFRVPKVLDQGDSS